MIIIIIVVSTSDDGLNFDKNVYTVSINESNDTQGYSLRQRIHCVYNEYNDISKGQSIVITYEVADGDHVPIEIEKNGELFVKKGQALDYEQMDIYSIVVMCRAWGDSIPLANDTATVEILVQPVNEFIPVFMEPDNITFSLSLSTPSDTVILSTIPGEGTYTYGPATDRDRGTDGIIRYLLEHGDTDNIFEIINETTGDVVISGMLVEVTYSFRIYACDGQRSEINCPYVSITVHVLSDINTNYSASYSSDAITLSPSLVSTMAVTEVPSLTVNHNQQAASVLSPKATTYSISVYYHLSSVSSLQDEVYPTATNVLLPHFSSIMAHHSANVVPSPTLSSLRTNLGYSSNKTFSSQPLKVKPISTSTQYDYSSMTVGYLSTVTSLPSSNTPKYSIMASNPPTLPTVEEEKVTLNVPEFFSKWNIILMSVSAGILAAVLAIAVVVCSILYCKQCSCG